MNCDVVREVSAPKRAHDVRKVLNRGISQEFWKKSLCLMNKKTWYVPIITQPHLACAVCVVYIRCTTPRQRFYSFRIQFHENIFPQARLRSMRARLSHAPEPWREREKKKINLTLTTSWRSPRNFWHSPAMGLRANAPMLNNVVRREQKQRMIRASRDWSTASTMTIF
jgi:hypothetical protein